MTANAIVRARIDEQIKEEASVVLAMRDARRGKTTKHKTLESLMTDLHAGD